MKTSLTKLSSSFILFTLSFGALAKPVAQVTEVNGTVFVVSPDGKTTSLKKNQHIEEKSEIMVEDGASITLNDYFDATYHLAGGSHLKFFNMSVQLKNGKAWIQSSVGKNPLALTTANGNASFGKGEFITTFNQTSSRSQFLVVNGDVEVSNVLDQNMKYVVSGGTFTTIDPDVENGNPRAPTSVGPNSLNAALADFKKLPNAIVKAEPVPARTIASVEEAPKKGEIVFITSNRLPASITEKYFKKITAKKVAPLAAPSLTATPVPIKIYGTSYKPAEPVIAPSIRTPASVPAPAVNMPKKATPAFENDPEFGSSLKKHADEQPKYSKELESLIHELKSY